jgi:hypothetical protein
MQSEVRERKCWQKKKWVLKLLIQLDADEYFQFNSFCGIFKIKNHLLDNPSKPVQVSPF